MVTRAPWISSSASLRRSTTTGLTRYLGAEDMSAEDKEILDAYADAIRSRLSSDVGVDPVPEEGRGSNADG